MQSQQNICDIKPNGSNQLPQLTMIYGRCLGVLNQTPDWTMMKIADDTGEMPVYVQSSLISVSESLQDECLLLVNDSGKSLINVDTQGNPCAIINGAQDIWIRRPAYNEFRKRSGRDEQAQAGQAATAQIAPVIQQQAQQTAEVSAVQPPVTLPAQAPPAKTPLAEQVKKDEKTVGNTPLSMLAPPWDLMGSAMLDCLETSTVVISEYVRRHPEHHMMLAPGAIKEMATTFFIQASKGGLGQ